MTDSERGRNALSILQDLHACAVFLTRFPAPAWPEAAARPLARAMWAFPLVGVAVAAVAGAVHGLADWIGLPPVLCALLAVAAGAVATGALHEDGLADFADGLGGGSTPERRLEIMSDGAVGACGALALVVAVAGRTAALAAIAETAGWSAALGALAAAAAISRGILPLTVAWMEPAKDEGLGRSAGRPGTPVWATALGAGVAVVLVAAPGGWSVCLVGAAAGAAAVGWTARTAVGGQTGDVLGAVQQAAEFLALVMIAGAVTQAG